MDGFKDANVREMFGIMPLVIIIVVMGVYPKPFIDYINPAVDAVIKIIQR
jgi:NADH-quinone oxidoreductase subunit M